MLGSQLGKFLILILFKQLLSDKIFLGQDKNFDLNFCSVHEEINSKMWYTLCNPRSALRKGVYHIFEFISNEPNRFIFLIV
jgi:hypothetical protein